MSGPVLKLDGLRVEYGRRGPLAKPPVVAVADVDLELRPGETLGLVGESGCGKSSLARAVMGFEKPVRGSVQIEGTDIARLRPAELRRLRRRFQMVQQDPFSGFDPRGRLGNLLNEVLAIYRIGSAEFRRERVAAALAAVGLAERFLDRLPHELSGGQLQRVSIARAFLLEPALVVLDEPVSALDVSVQAQVVNLLLDLQRERDNAYLFITHDLGVLRAVAHRVAVMYLGRIVELGSIDEIFGAPKHPYTAALLDAAPSPDPYVERTRERIVLRGDLPDPRNAPPGCAFASRCFLRVRLGSPDRCTIERPLLRIVGPAHEAACHFTADPTPISA